MDDAGGSTSRGPNVTPPDPTAPDAQAAEPASAADVQLFEVRERLVRDAATAGVDEQLVDTAVQEAAAALAQAPVQNFVGILVERAVRERLRLRRLI
jgi:hypothetical protein